MMRRVAIIPNGRQAIEVWLDDNSHALIRQKDVNMTIDHNYDLLDDEEAINCLRHLADTATQFSQMLQEALAEPA